MEIWGQDSLRILIINHEFPPLGGGASNASWFLARALKKMGHEITIITSSYKGFPKYEYKYGMHINRVSSLRRKIDSSNILEMSTFIFFGILSSKKIVKERRINVTIAFFTIPGGVVGYFIYKIFKVPYIVSLRGGDVPGLVPELLFTHKMLTILRRKILDSAKKVVANSTALKKLSEKYDAIKVVTIPNGVDTNFFRPLTRRRNVSIFRFIFVGRLHSQKNLIYLLDYMAVLKKKVDRNFTLEIVGNGPQKQELLKYSKKIGISNNILWSNWLNKADLLRKYQYADCLLLPSLYEGMSNVLLESMACGLAVIASDIGANQTLIKNGLNGFLFSLEKPEQLLHYSKMLILSKNKTKLIGKAARKFVVDKFTWDITARNYLKLIMNE